MNSFSEKLDLLLDKIHSHNDISYDQLLEKYIQERLNKSLQTYYNELKLNSTSVLNGKDVNIIKEL